MGKFFGATRVTGTLRRRLRRKLNPPKYRFILHSGSCAGSAIGRVREHGKGLLGQLIDHFALRLEQGVVQIDQYGGFNKGVL